MCNAVQMFCIEIGIICMNRNTTIKLLIIQLIYTNKIIFKKEKGNAHIILISFVKSNPELQIKKHDLFFLSLKKKRKHKCNKFHFLSTF